MSNDPMAFVPKLPEVNCQFDPFSALSVRQTPPPAAATYSVHLPCVHVGEIAIAVTRPLATYCAPSKRNGLRTAGYVALLGPINCQAPDECAPAFSAFQPFSAAMLASPGTSVLG